jgi:hypothetical protein
MKLPISLVTVALIGAPCPVSAEMTVAGYLGAVRTMSAPLTIVQPASGTDVRLASVQYRGESFKPPLYYGARLTWFSRQTSWWGLEAEFIHLKAYARTEQRTTITGRYRDGPVAQPVILGTIVERFSISHGLNFVLVNGVVRQTFSPHGRPGRLTLLGRVGVGQTIPHAESTISGVSREGYAWGAVGLHGAASFEVRLEHGLAALAEYKFTRTRQAVAVDRGEARGVFASHHAVFGLAWHF